MSFMTLHMLVTLAYARLFRTSCATSPGLTSGLKLSLTVLIAQAVKFTAGALVSGMLQNVCIPV